MKPDLARSIILALALTPGAAFAQGVTVAPTAVFIDARIRTASLIVVNPNAEAVEVEIGSFYGYAITDSSGQISLKTVDAPDSTMPSLAGWIQAFPRRMTLEGKAQQTVRLLVSPPPTIADGEYWGRLSILARGGQIALSSPSSDSGVKVGLSVEVRTVIPVFYRKGKVASGIALSGLRAQRAGDSLMIRMHLDRSGSAAAMGTARGELIDSTGRSRATFTAPVAAYFAIDPRFSMPLDSVPPGTYRLRLEVAAGREGISPESIIPFAAVRDSLTVRLP